MSLLFLLPNKLSHEEPERFLSIKAMVFWQEKKQEKRRFQGESSFDWVLNFF